MAYPTPTLTAKTTASADRPVSALVDQPGTPMAERIAVVGLLNKRNGQTRDFELKPGEAVRFGKVVIRVRACEKTAPWETYQDQGYLRPRSWPHQAIRTRLPENPGRQDGRHRWFLSGDRRSPARVVSRSAQAEVLELVR